MATVASHSDIAQFVPDYSAQFLGELQGILEKAQRFSGATGAAIAFVEGNELVTKSGLGPSAPEVGSRSPIQGSFTGLSVQTREVQRCDDASHDSRVDSHACAALGISSMVIVPIGDKSKTFGVLAGFASKPNAFTPTHVALLRTLADIVVELWNRYPMSQQAGTAVATPPNVEAPKPPASAKVEPVQRKAEPVASAPAPKATVAAAPKVEPAKFETPKSKPANVPPGAIKLTDAPIVVAPIVEEAKPEPKRESKPVSKPEPLRIERKPEVARHAPVIDIGAGREKQEEVLSSAADIGPVVVTKATPTPVPSFSGYGNSALSAYEQHERAETGSKRILMIAAVVVVVAALAVGGYFVNRRGSKSQAAQTNAALTTAASTAPASQVSEPVSAAPTTNSATVSASAEKPVEHLAKAEKIEKPASKTPEPAPKKEHAPIMVAGGSEIPRRNVTAENVDAPSVIATSAGDASGILGMVKTAQPKAAFKSSQVTPPELVRRVPPQYPSFAKQWHLKNERVVLNATVGKDGNVTDVKLVSGKQVFVDAAISAVRQWKYKPAYLNGEPVSASIEVDLDFTN